ncbi:XkdW protein [compost metagenome]
MAIDYNRLTLGVDYDIVERGPYIAVWNLSEPQPTEQELQTAWNAIKDIPLEYAHPTETERVNTLEKENEILKTQNQALANRIELIEKLIAEKRI